MKTLTVALIALFSANVFCQVTDDQAEGGVQVMTEKELRGTDEVEAQLQEAKENVKTDEKNIQKAEARKKESQAKVEKLEEQLGDDGKKQNQEKKGLFD